MLQHEQDGLLQVGTLIEKGVKSCFLEQNQLILLVIDPRSGLLLLQRTNDRGLSFLDK